MKKLFALAIVGIASMSLAAQENIDDLLAAGIADAQRFSEDYLAPGTEGVAFGINNGWFNSGGGGKQFSFELSLIGSASFIDDNKKSFQLNTADYQNVRFPDNSASQTVATVLGDNDPEITVIVTYDDPIFGDQEVALTLPTGIAESNVSLIPTAFLQGSFSIFKGTRLKARFFPTVKAEDAELGIYGVGIQQEFTSWLPADKIWPVAISGLFAYTHLDGSFDLSDSSTVDGENQIIETNTNTYLFELIASTKLKVINFYGAIGYLSGTSQTDLLGTYRVSDGNVVSEDIVNPFSIEQDISGVRTTLGANLKLGFFGINADYTIAEFDSASLGINFSF